MNKNHKRNQFIEIIIIFVMLFECQLIALTSTKILPIKKRFTGQPLEPSGITIYRDQLLFVSDNDNDRAVYELILEIENSFAKIFIRFNHDNFSKIAKRQKIDLEGIVAIKRNLFCVDERNRFVYKIWLDGKIEQVMHDIMEYNTRNDITFSANKNAGFEGIAFDPQKNLMFIANEKEDAIIYILDFRKNFIKTTDSISMTGLSGIDDFDISDIHFQNDFLYLIHRKGREILKLDPYKKNIKDSYDFSYLTNNLYRAKKKYGLAEGLALTEKSIFLLLDSGGNKMMGQDRGENGALIVIKRPPEF